MALTGSNPSPEQAGAVSYFTTKPFEKALQLAFLSGGQAQKRSDKARIVLGSLQDSDPFVSLPVTKHGETRIKNCVKYELGDGWRLVTRQTDKTCTFLFVGDHEDTERWIAGHKGESIGVKDSRLIRVPGIGNDPVSRSILVDHHDRPLVDMLDVAASDHLLLSLSPSLVRKFGTLDGGCSAKELNDLLALVPNPSKMELLRKVFCLLLEGNVDGAEAHIDLSMGRIAPVEEFDSKDMLDVSDGEDVRRLRVGSAEYEEWINAFERRSTWYDWFLFLHPEQEAIVNADYPGVSQLSGVSGSGKTCVAVRRAMRLAKKDGANVLLLTLNRSLSGMLRQLVDVACSDDVVRSRIEVTSFFELARSMLMSFEPANSRHYEDVTWKLDEHVDEIFREYYRCWANNHDAGPLLALHKSLNARGVNGETYIRQEFDWIRSAVQPGARDNYLGLERKGRKFPIAADRRTDLLAGLLGWENKMRAVGVIDYLGLTSALATHMDKIGHKYTNILVDEAQDFGTTELAIVRMLVPPGANDIFLCGDVAQTVLPKQRSVVEAGLANITREQIRRNYRNSREILAAAYELLKANLHEELFESGDLEVLDPKFANFSGSAPVALAADSLEEEIAYARNYVATHLQMGTRNLCIAFAGFSSRDVREYALKCGVTALDGAYDPNTDRLVFSDLEQTKGYEFDVLIVVNCCEDILPARDAPLEEGFRDICKLYVAMTRAKRELVLSFHGPASKWLKAVSGTISMDHWHKYENLDGSLLQGTPMALSELDPNMQSTDSLSLTGAQFLYTSDALGLSPDAQEKLVELVDGKGLIRAGGGRRLKWTTIGSLLSDLTDSRMQDSLLGSIVADEVRSKLSHLLNA
ncbi:MAG: hypothetical protein QOJ84_2997 [Bradyrhizobium sp.]|nr:hypothetical protein [Bradyrhizobium sp.]